MSRSFFDGACMSSFAPQKKQIVTIFLKQLIITMDVMIMTILATNYEDDGAVIDAAATGDHDHDVLASG